MDKRSERFYDIITLNRWFAVSSLILLVTVIWMVWDDYDRPWKTAQREFFGLDIDSAHAALQEENERIARQGELQKLEADLAQAKEDLSARAADLAEAEANLRILEPHLYRVNQDYAFAKAILDTRRYEFETARATHGKGHAETTRAEEAYRKAEEVAEERRQIDQRVAAERDAAAERLDRLVGHQGELEKQRTRLTAGVKVQRRRLQALQPGLAATIRNLPILDFANPSVKVRQIVLRQFERDYHFADVFRVDRCMTCHMGIDRPDFRDAPQPFTTHPRLDLYLSASSAHPVASYGCTVCHGGKGRATDFVDAAHTPASDEERSRWEYKYGWHRLHHWEHPMFPGDVVESSCRKCHMEQDTIRGAELYNEGKLLYERVGCFNCHITEGFTEEFRRVGPSLAHVADKVTPEWAFRWIEDPTALRPTTRMPRFFGLSNNSDPVSLARSDVEVRSLVAYVFGQSTPQGLVEVPAQHDANEGETLFRTVGCVACHVVDDAQDPRASAH